MEVGWEVGKIAPLKVRNVYGIKKILPKYFKSGKQQQ